MSVHPVGAGGLELVGALTAEAVPAADLPRFLLEQKPNLVPERFYAVAAGGLPIHAFLIHERGQPRPISCWFMLGSPIYEGLLIDTFVVDKPLRTEARVRACMQLCRDVCVRLLRALDLRIVAWSTDRPDRMMELIDDPRIRPVETTLVLDLGGEN